MRENMSNAVGNAVAISQMLSEASSEQASSLEETSASLDQTASMTKRNAENIHQANQMMTDSKCATLNANEAINELTKSMGN
jgi:methyl-accepting chemotaxis protein